MAENKHISIPGRIVNALEKEGIAIDSKYVAVKDSTLENWVSDIDEKLKNGVSGDTTKIEEELASLKTTHDTDIAEIRESLKNVEPNEKVKELETADLNAVEFLESGIYSIKTTTNAPENSKTGKLTVKKVEDGSYQEWISSGIFGFRKANMTNSEISKFKVDGKEVEIVNNTVELQASNVSGSKLSYTLSGYLNGHIVINSDDNTAAEPTTIILDNCYINSDTEMAISYKCINKTLKIRLADNSHNYILCNTSATPSEVSSNGAIDSGKNIEISGIGYLSIKTNYNSHGIDAGDDLIITGKPHIYIDACNGHDGIHCGNSFIMENGEVEIHNANDGIGLGSSTTAEVRIFGGKLSVFDLKQDAIDAKLLQDKAATSTYAYVYTDYATVNFTEDNCSKTKFVNSKNYSSSGLYNAGSVEIVNADKTTTAVELSASGDYELLTKSAEYIIKGYISQNINITGQSIDLTLQNACVAGDINYSPSKKKMKIKSDDTERFLEKDTDGNVCHNVNIVCGNINSNNNLSITGKAYLFIKTAVASNKLHLIGNGTKYANSITTSKFYIGADDEDYDAAESDNATFEQMIDKNGKYDLESKQILYINSLTTTATDTTESEPGIIKAASTIYDVQTGDFFIDTLTLTFPLKRDAATGGRYITKEIIAGTSTTNFEFSALDTDFINVDYIEKVVSGKWTVLKENPEIDLSGYAKQNDIHVKVYTNRDAADDALDSLSLGDIVSYGSGADDSVGLRQGYDILIVSLDSSGSKVFKEIKQGGGSSDTGTVTFELMSISINGTNLDDLTNKTFETNIGDVIEFKMALISQNYPNIRGSVRGLLNGRQTYESTIIPDGSNIVTWTYNTSGMSAGTYNFTLYGIESTGKQSKRTTYQAKIGGIHLTSTMNDDDVVKANSQLSIPVTFETADSSITSYINVELNGVRYNAEKETIKVGLSYVTIKSIPAGNNNIKMYATNENGKTSNVLEFNIIAAEENKLYVTIDQNEYDIASGGDLFVKTRIIQLGQSSSKFKATLVYKNSSGEEMSSLDNEYSLKYGSQLLHTVGIKYISDDGTIEENEKDVHYSLYTATLTVLSPDESLSETVTFTIKCKENDYDIDTKSIDDKSLLCWFDAAGKSNNSLNYNTWEDKSVDYRPVYDEDKTPVKATFNNFNWTNNGWLDDNGDGTGNTALSINSGAYVTLDIMPFKTEPGTQTNSNGITISVDFQTKNILSEDAKVVSCLCESNGTEDVYYYLRDGFGEYIKNSNDNITNYFKNAGGYCWIDGVYYTGDGTTAYETTMIMPERVPNYNNASSQKNTEFNNPNEAATDILKANKIIDSEYKYDSTKDTDYRVFLGYVSESITQQTGFYIDTAYAVMTTANDPSSKDSKFHVNFSENTRTHIDFVLQSRSNEEPYYFRSMVCYVNGILSNMQDLSATSKFSIANYKVYLGAKVKEDEFGNEIVSDTGDCKIYSFRIYDKALSPDQILRLYASSIPDESEKRTFIDNNGVSSDSMPYSLPEVCLYGYQDSSYATPSINKFIMQTATSETVSELKKVKEPAYVTYIDRKDESKSWCNNQLIPIRLQFQGTSSMVYPCKNYKFKTYSPYSDTEQKVYDKDAGFLFTTDSKGNKVFSGYNNNKKIKFDIGNGIAERTFCLKADFMDSSHCNNTGVANFIADSNILSGQTPPQELNNFIRTTVYGYPVLLYYCQTPDTASTKYFLGVYNLNLDKSDTDSFGWDKTISDMDGVKHKFGQTYFYNDEISKNIGYNESTETIELPDGAVTKQYTVIKDGSNNIIAAKSEKGYIRSVNNDEVPSVECFEVKANSNGQSAGGFGSFDINQVSNDFEIRYPDEGDLEDEEYLLYKDRVGTGAVDFKTFSQPWFYQLQRLIYWIKNSDKNEFVSNLERHFNKNYLMDYYLAFMMLGAVDSLGKNLMIGTWGPENHLYNTTEEKASSDYLAFQHTLSNGTTIWVTPTKTKLPGNDGIEQYSYAEDENGKNLFYDETVRIGIKNQENGYRFNDNEHRLTEDIAKVTTTPGECIWYPTFYDIDTICGLDNAGVLCYDTDIEVGELTADGNAVYNTADSQLWTRVRDYLGELDNDEVSMLSERWGAISSKFNLATLIGGEFRTSEDAQKGHFYDEQIATIPAKYYNDDCFIKYIYEGPFKPGETIPGKTEVAKRGTGSYLYCVHGSRYEQMKRWFTQRLYFLNTLYRKTGATGATLRFENAYCDPAFNADDINYYSEPAQLAAKGPDSDGGYYTYENEELRYHKNGDSKLIKPITFSIEPYQPAYIGIRWYNGAKTWYKKSRRYEPVNIVGNTKTDSNAEVFIYGGENIKDLGDLSEYAVSEFNIENLTKVARLIFGPTTASFKLTTLTLNNNYLSEINLEGYKNLSQLDLSQCINLKTVKTKNSTIQNITLPTNGALETISYGSSVTSIILQDLLNLKTVITGNVGSLNTLIIKNCPKLQGSHDAYNASAWEILQRTEGAPLSSTGGTVDVEAYGEVTPTASGFFFPNKYCLNSDEERIKLSGEIRYTGTKVPSNYILFRTRFPNLKIEYPNIDDASEMFANYKNLQCIQSINANAGSNSYGEQKSVKVYYWKDRREDDFNYSADQIYNEKTTKIYSDGTNTYRLIDVYDDKDLDVLRKEIKENLSGFKKFINVSKMFYNMKILDYLDPDTFNGIDLSEADTTEMFAGCENLKYFEMPGDKVKHLERIVYYINDEEVTETTYNETEDDGVNIKTTKTMYVSPFDDDNRANYSDIKESVYGKGIRTIGTGMFNGCKKLRLFVRKLLVNCNLSKTTETTTPDTITIYSDAFKYPCYNPDDKDGRIETGATLDRPAIFFEHKKKDVCLRTKDSKTVISENEVEYDNPLVEDVSDDEENKYYALNQYGECQINLENDGKFKPFSIMKNDTTWLRECYFNVAAVYLNKTKVLNESDDNILSYAETYAGERILIDVIPSTTSFNIFNEYNIVSEVSGAIPLLGNASKINALGISVQTYDCFDTSIPRADIEKSIYNVLCSNKNNTVFQIDKIDVYTQTFSLTDFYIYSKNNLIKEKSFSYFNKIQYIHVHKDIEVIEAKAFSNNPLLKEIRYFRLNASGNAIQEVTYSETTTRDQYSNIKSIGDSAFSNCPSLEEILTLPKSLVNIGSYVFQNDTTLKYVLWKCSNITEIPAGTFQGATSLMSITDDPNNSTPYTIPSFITKINDNAFESTDLILFDRLDINNTCELCITNAPNISYIGKSAFRGVKALYGNPTKKNIFRILPKITFIGDHAFSVEVYNIQYPIILEWGNGTANYNTDFASLVIESNAFENVQFITENDFEEQLADGITNRQYMTPSIFVPRISAIGNSAFKPYNASNPFKYCLMRNDDSVGKYFVNGSKKIIYNYQNKITVENSTGGIDTIILISKKLDGYDGEGYIYRASSQSYTIDNYVTYNDKKYAITQILEGAFDKVGDGYCTGLSFKYNSNMQKIESNVITSKQFENLMCGNSDDTVSNNTIPEGLEFGSGNVLKNSAWYNKYLNEKNDSGEYTIKPGSYVVLGKYIIGYKFTDSDVNSDDGTEPTYSLDLNNATYTENNVVKKCTVIYDDAFSEETRNSKLISVTFPSDCDNYYINDRAFFNCIGLTSITLPNNIKYVGNSAFKGNCADYIFLPNTIEEIGTNVFTNASPSDTATMGKLKFLNIEEGSRFTGSYPLSLNQEALLINNTTGDKKYVNITFNSVHIPATMYSILDIESGGMFSNAISMRNVYVGSLEMNTDPDDKNYNTIYCKNYPLYKKPREDGKSFDVVFDSIGSDGTEYEQYTTTVNDIEVPVYCYKFYHDMCIYANRYTARHLDTTDEYSVCPIGYKSGSDSSIIGFTGNINLINVKEYDRTSFQNNTEGSDTEENIKLFEANLPKNITRENLLALLAGFKPNQSRSKISLSNSAASLDVSDTDLLSFCLKINFTIVRTVD